MKKITALLSICIILFWFGSIPEAAGTATSPNILLITIDTLRPDHLGCYGYETIKTPHIDNLAKEGVLFTNAFTPVPLTFPSHVSIMTGQYPIQHGVYDNGNFYLTDSANTLSEILQSNGYTTGAIVASFTLASSCGLNQGFSSYDDDINGKPGEKGKNHDQFYRQGETITHLAKAWLLKNHKKPFFLWVHYFDPHAPYSPPAPFDTLYKMPYDGEIAFTDQCLGHLFEEMQKQGIMDNTFIILVGDHGEGLWEHNEQGHGLFIYNTTLKVPLIMHYPKLFPPRQKVTSLVGTIDIMPTILESLEIKSKGYGIQGKSLIPLLTGKEKDIRQMFYGESLYSQLNFNWAPLEGIVTSDGWKYIQAPKPELYNLGDDPKEKTNLYSKNPQEVNYLQKELLGFKKALLQEAGSHCSAKQTVPLPETEEKLRSLGYIRGKGINKEAKNVKTAKTSKSMKTSKNMNTRKSIEEQSASLLPDLPDPKDKAPLLAQIDRARELDAQGQADKSIRMFERVLREDPNNIMAHHCLGLAYRDMGKLREAVNEIQKVVEIDPGYYDCLDLLGSLYDHLAMPEDAIGAYKHALKINPSSTNVHNNLGIVYLKMNALDPAKGEFKKAIALSSDQILTSVAFCNLGEIDFRCGNLERAVEKFKRSIGLNQFNRDAYIGLADVYFRLKDIEQSIHEWEEVARLWPDDYISYYKIAQLLLSINKSNQAIDYLRKCLQIRPDYIDARLLLQQISSKSHS